MARELSEWSVMDIANEMRQRSIMLDLELFAALEKAKQATPDRSAGDFLAQKMFLSELRRRGPRRSLPWGTGSRKATRCS